jgi:LysM repeat protein
MQKLFRLATCILFVFVVQHASSQTNYIKHTLTTGETLSALAKLYNTSVGDIMRMNGMHADSKLVYGSVIKIPSTQKNANKAQHAQTVKQNVASSASGNMVRHTVVKGETLYSISKKYNVSIEQLKTWNHLTDNGVNLGNSLIVGNSTVASAPSDTKRQRVETTQQVEQATTQPQQEKTIVNNVVEKTNTNNADIKANNTVATNQPAATENNYITSTISSAQNGPGYFEDQFNTKGKHKKHVSGVSKTFKTASGWSDGKYYLLADNINPGTIVKLTADNGKSVYAKVLWNMSDLKEGNDVDFRVSNATAAALNENNPSFHLTINY